MNAQIKLLSNGYIGLGTTAPTTNVEIKSPNVLFKSSTSTYNVLLHYYNNASCIIEPSVNNQGYLGCNYRWGTIKASTVNYLYLVNGSDIRIKENIRNLENSLDKVLKLRGVKYDYAESYLLDPNDTEGSARLVEEGKDQIGMIAQELLPIVPEAVKYDSVRDEYGINYVSLIPILIEAIKEQDKKIKDLDKKIKDVTKLAFAAPGQSKSAEEELITTSQPSRLGKNRPNPFSENTTIEFYLPAEVQHAMFYIYDLQGKQLKSIRVTERNEGNVVIQGAQLQPGIYYYSLIADGQVVGTEQMILTD